MAQRRKTKGRHARGRFSTIHSDAAGIDVGSRFHVVAVAPGRDAEPLRTFQSFTQDLHRLADWLKTVGITTVAMESTGVYWIRTATIIGVESTTGAVAVGRRGVAVCRQLSPCRCLTPRHNPVSSRRSSIRTCRSPASGSRTRSCLRPRKARRSRLKKRETVVLPQSRV